jgi:hypothetical protein
VTDLILERPPCEACILTKSGLRASELDETLTIVAAAMVIYDQIGRCRACGETKRVLALERPGR